MSSIILLGGGSHAKEVLNIYQILNIKVLGYFDTKETSLRLPYLGPDEGYKAKKYANTNFMLGVGDQKIRRKILNHMVDRIPTMAIVHPFTFISKSSTIGRGSVVLPGATVSVDVHVGENCIINTGSTISHDCRLEENTVICPGVHIAGNCSTGCDSFLGTGAIVIPKRKIGSGVVVGAGGCVVKDLDDDCTYIGVPARLKENK